MAKVIHTVPHLITPINGVAFQQLEREQGGSISEEISDEVAQNFLLVPTFELHVDPMAAPAAPEKPARETAAERKARLAAEEAKRLNEEKAAADKAAADKEEADRLAAEELARLAAEEQERIAAEKTANGEDKPEGEDEVF